MVELRDVLPLRPLLAFQTQILAHIVEKIRGAQFGIENVGCFGIPVQTAQDRLDKSGLPGSNLTGDNGKPLSLPNRIGEVGQGFFVTFTEIEKPRIRRDLKGFLSETVELIIHRLSSLFFNLGYIRQHLEPEGCLQILRILEGAVHLLSKEGHAKPGTHPQQ